MLGGELIHFSELFFKLDWLYIEGTIDPKCLGKELWKLGGLERKNGREKSKVVGQEGWGAAPARPPQKLL